MKINTILTQLIEMFHYKGKIIIKSVREELDGIK